MNRPLGELEIKIAETPKQGKNARLAQTRTGHKAQDSARFSASAFLPTSLYSWEKVRKKMPRRSEANRKNINGE